MTQLKYKTKNQIPSKNTLIVGVLQDDNLEVLFAKFNIL